MLRGYVEERSVRRTMKQLKALRKSAIPLAVRGTLNDLAFQTREVAQARIRRDFTNRSKFTEKRVIVEKARQRDVRKMAANVGHTEEYMATQEFGGTVSGSGRYKPIPTNEARIAKSAQQLVRRALYLSAIGLGRGRGQRRKYFVASPKGRLGLFVRKARGKVRILYSLAQRNVRVPRRAWLKPSRDEVATPGNVRRVFERNAAWVFKRFRS